MATLLAKKKALERELASTRKEAETFLQHEPSAINKNKEAARPPPPPKKKEAVAMVEVLHPLLGKDKSKTKEEDDGPMPPLTT